MTGAGASVVFADRPKSVRLFDWLFLLARLLSALPGAYGYISAYAAGRQPADLDASGLVIYYILSFSVLLPPILLWFFVSKKASRIAKWLLVAFVTYEAFAVVVNAVAGVENYAGYEFIIYGVVALDLAAMALLHRADSRAWFKRKAKFGGIDPETFQ